MTEPNAAGSENPPPRDNTLWELFSRTVGDNPDAEAVVDTRRDRRFTYKGLHEHVTRLAGALTAAGVDRGDTFATLLRNGIEQTAALLVASRLGATVATVNYRYSTSDVAHVLADCDPSLVVFDENTRSTLDAVRGDLTVERYLYAGEDPPAYTDSYWERATVDADAAPSAAIRDPDGPIYLPYTAGTTGRPKGCRYAAGVVDLARSAMTVFGIGNERLVSVVPQAHAMGGWGGGTVPVLGGGTILTIPEFDPERVLETIEAESVTALLAVPVLLGALVAAGPERFDTDSLATLVSMGASLPAELATAVEEAFGLAAFYNRLAATETGWIFARDVRTDLDTALSPGTAIPNVETRVVRTNDDRIENGIDPTQECMVGETGSLLVASPYGMDGYAGSPDATAERSLAIPTSEASGGTGATEVARQWYDTGDRGYMDEDGWFWPEGRRADAIRSGDITVSDHHVEDVLREHPAIAAVSVVGVPDERWGERIVACVVANDGSVTENLIAWAREQPALADHERPTEIVFFEDLPRSAILAVRKAALRGQLTETETR